MFIPLPEHGTSRRFLSGLGDAAPPPEPLVEGLGAYFGPGGALSGGASHQKRWDYPMFDVIAEGPGGCPSPSGAPCTDWIKPVQVQFGYNTPPPPNFAILCTTISAWPVPTHFAPFGLGGQWGAQIIAGPREKWVVNYYMTPGQWVTLGLYDEWVAAGKPTAIAMGQHDNTDGSPSWEQWLEYGALTPLVAKNPKLASILRTSEAAVANVAMPGAGALVNAGYTVLDTAQQVQHGGQQPVNYAIPGYQPVTPAHPIGSSGGSIVATVRANPIPAILLGAGIIATIAFLRRKKRR